MVNLLGLSPSELAAFCAGLGEKPFRAKQLMRWIHQAGVDDFGAMTDISKANANKKYIDTSKIIDPASIDRYMRGNSARLISQLRNFPTYSEDMSLQKNFVPREGFRIQFRAEGLNVFNRHRFTGINTNPASPLFGQISGVSDDRRQIQFGVRADF